MSDEGSGKRRRRRSDPAVRAWLLGGAVGPPPAKVRETDLIQNVYVARGDTLHTPAPPKAPDPTARYSQKRLAAFFEVQQSGSFAKAYKLGIKNYARLLDPTKLTLAKSNFRRAYRRFSEGGKVVKKEPGGAFTVVSK